MDPIKVKVIIRNGIVEAVLHDSRLPIEAEIVDIDDDYEDRDALEKYADRLYADRRMSGAQIAVAHFEEAE